MKFVCDMTYGMLASGSSMLSEIARNLNEKIPLIKTVNRLSRNLQDLSDDERNVVMDNYLKAIKPNYNDQSVIVIDGSDITKPASTKLEALCQVRDGSTGEIGIGYHTIGAAVLSSENKLPFSFPGTSKSPISARWTGVLTITVITDISLKTARNSLSEQRKTEM